MIPRILILISLFSISTHANNSFSSGKVMSIILHDSGKVLIYLNGGIQTDEACTSMTHIVLKKSHQHFSEIYSALLAAYHSGTSVAGWVNGCDDSHNMPLLTRLDLIPK